MGLSVRFVALVLIVFGPTLLSDRVAQPDVCRVTLPNGRSGNYGNSNLSVAGLWSDGTIMFKPGGPGFVTSDGALGMKFLWMRGARGKISISGHRLDGAARPLRFEASYGMGDIGFQASYLIFPTPS